MLKTIVPPMITVVELSDGESPGPLLPVEEQALGRVLPSRRKHFMAGRHCARRALESAGFGPAAVLIGRNGAARWPDGVVGSITHTEGYCAAAVAAEADYWGLGVDVQANSGWTAEMGKIVVTESEQRMLQTLPRGVCPWEYVLFSAKESCYKALSSQCDGWLGFADVEIEVRPWTGRFTARLRRESRLRHHALPSVWEGRLCMTRDHTFTAVAMKRSDFVRE